ncbi:MAG: type II toxin-antitoxin system VapC family toxin [Acidimicrobiales bacterium]
MNLYLDSSALVKLVQVEPESGPLRRFLRRHRSDRLVTATLARTEIVRAVLPAGPVAVGKARRQLGRLEQVVLGPDLLDRAATLAPGVRLRSLDAIHLSAAVVAGADLRAVVTYDHRMAEAATQLGIAVESPA